MTADVAKKAGISISELLRRSYIRKKTLKESRFEIPEGVPRWAVKYKFTRKKYGIQEIAEEKVSYKMTLRGVNALKFYNGKKQDVEEKDNTNDEEVVEGSFDV